MRAGSVNRIIKSRVLIRSLWRHSGDSATISQNIASTPPLRFAIISSTSMTPERSGISLGAA